jgi:DNA polymerase-3 subunit chi
LTRSPLRVDFYVLSTTETRARFHFTCRLAEKVYRLNQRIYTHMNSAAEVRQLDELLWTFRDGSFLPHATLPPSDEKNGSPEPITIGHGEQSAIAGDVLINLTDAIPAFFDQFPRVAEIVDSTPECRRLGRERFSFYRDNGYEPATHKIS